jgi:protein phosphatase
LTSGRVGLSSEVARHAVGRNGTLLVVSDGMGGAAAGEVASAMAVSIVSSEMMRYAPSGVSAVDALREATTAANGDIWGKSQSDSRVRGLGATLTAAYLLRNVVYLAQVGDSRAYLIRGGAIRQLTEDQSWVNAIKKAGIDIPNVPSNVILQALGTQQTVNAEITAEALQAGDVLLLCSDGLSNKIGDDEMASLVVSSPGLEEACRRMVDLANERGGEDNITVVIAQLDDGVPRRANVAARPSAPFNAEVANFPPPAPSFSPAPDAAAPSAPQAFPSGKAFLALAVICVFLIVVVGSAAGYYVVRTRKAQREAIAQNQTASGAAPPSPASIGRSENELDELEMKVAQALRRLKSASEASGPLSDERKRKFQEYEAELTRFQGAFERRRSGRSESSDPSPSDMARRLEEIVKDLEKASAK